MSWPRLRTLQKIALAGFAASLVRGVRHLAGHDAVVRVRRGGLQWELDLHEGVDFAIYLLGRFEAGTARAYERIVRPGSTVLDIGANIGAHTLPLARLTGPQGRVIAFEPTGYACRKLLTNLALNPFLREQVIVEQMLLTERDNTGTIPSHLPSSWPLVSHARRHELHGGVAKETAGAHASCLDTYLATAGVDRVDFIKLDVDGHECAVLDGARSTLHRHRPVISLEIAPYALREYGTSAAELSDRLSDLGYSLFDERTGRPLPDGPDLEELLPAGTSQNALARPNSSYRP